jgi:hypothetical protein
MALQGDTRSASASIATDALAPLFDATRPGSSASPTAWSASIRPSRGAAASGPDLQARGGVGDPTLFRRAPAALAARAPRAHPVIPDLPGLRFQAVHSDDVGDAYWRARRSEGGPTPPLDTPAVGPLRVREPTTGVGVRSP